MVVLALVTVLAVAIAMYFVANWFAQADQAGRANRWPRSPRAASTTASANSATTSSACCTPPSTTWRRRCRSARPAPARRPRRPSTRSTVTLPASRALRRRSRRRAPEARSSTAAVMPQACAWRRWWLLAACGWRRGCTAPPRRRPPQLLPERAGACAAAGPAAGDVLAAAIALWSTCRAPATRCAGSPHAFSARKTAPGRSPMPTASRGRRPASRWSCRSSRSTRSVCRPTGSRRCRSFVTTASRRGAGTPAAQPDGKMVVSAANFEAQLEWLARNDYRVLRLSHLAGFLAGKRPLPRARWSSPSTTATSRCTATPSRCSRSRLPGHAVRLHRLHRRGRRADLGAAAGARRVGPGRHPGAFQEPPQPDRASRRRARRGLPPEHRARDACCRASCSSAGWASRCVTSPIRSATPTRWCSR